MKPFHLILIILSPLFAISNGFILKGNIDGLQTGTVSLEYKNETGEDTALSIHFTDGRFSLSGMVQEPALVRLTFTDGWSYNLNLFLENAAINISLVKDMDEKTVITGSRSNAVYEKLKPGLNDFFAHARESKSAHEYAVMMHDDHAIAAADSLWAAQQGQWIKSISAAIATDHDNYAALYFIQWLLFKPDHMDAIKAVFMQLSPAVREGAAGKKFLADFEHLQKTAPGKLAPEINGKDTSGQTRMLASYKGKVVLLDFWASYCGPCRQENRKMLPVYQKYHAAGFDIVSFSLDNERSLWTAAIRADGLPWAQASDLRGGAGTTAGAYDITDLPRNVLIDRAGKIYAKDLHGEDLIKAIEGLLKKGE